MTKSSNELKPNLSGSGGDVAQALEKATKEIESERQEALREKERQRQITEALAKRSGRWQMPASNTVSEIEDMSHAVSDQEHEATAKQVNYIRVLGLDLNGIIITNSQASRVISQLKSGICDISEV